MQKFLKRPLFEGIATAMVTPFTESGIDFTAFENLIERQLDSGISALVILGTTGEPCTLSYEEYEKAVTFAVNKVNKRVPLIVGAGANCTDICVKKAKICSELGVDGILVVTPYYNKCTQNGLIKHYETISNATTLPIIAYNVPSRTGVNLLPETALKLSRIDNVFALKDACNDLVQSIETAELLKGIMPIYCGDDKANLNLYKLGAIGAISVVSNLYPKEVVSVYDNFKRGEKSAYTMQNKLTKINEGLFIEVNPIPVKYALYKKGFIKNILRLPLTEIEKEHAKIIDRIMEEYENRND